MAGKRRSNSESELERLRRRIAELKATEDQLSVVHDALSSSLSGVLIADLAGEIVYVNGAFLDMFEYRDQAEILGKSTADHISSQKAESLTNIMAAIGKANGEILALTVQRRDGTVFSVEASVSNVTDNAGKVVGRMVSFIDVTERKAMEEQLRHHERLAVLGQLAGGIAHELRNPLSWIKGSSILLQDLLEDGDAEVQETLEILRGGVVKAERVLEGLLRFAQPGPPERRQVDVNEILRSELSAADISDDIELVSRLSASLPPILADVDQLGLLFRNIIHNAIQAMPGGGQLTIRTETGGPTCVSISIFDTGLGISQENLERIFEPLFTTKQDGIGLGLALVKVLTEGHGGSLEVTSEVGVGSTFTVHLPVNP
jgi:PAS domain S-box-containing protein